MTDSVIYMENVSLIRNGVYLLNQINWVVKKREHWALIGLNGAGKTLLLNIVNGYLFPSQGVVSILGKEFGRFDLRELRKSIGWVSSSLLERLLRNDTAFEIVLTRKYATLGLYDQPPSSDEEKARWLLKRVGCDKLGNRPYAILSQGEKQRVLIARALMADPKLLILDEPCTGLDIFAREQLLTMIQELMREEEAPTIIYVTHHLEEILPEISHVIILKDGKPHSSGPKKEILTSSNISDFLECNAEVQWVDDRAWLQLKNLLK